MLVTSHACFIAITSKAIMHYTVQKMNNLEEVRQIVITVFSYMFMK